MKKNLTYNTNDENIEYFLAHLQSLDIQLNIKNNRLKMNAPKGVVTVSLREAIKRRKAEIICFYQSKETHSTAGVLRRSRQESLPCSFAQQRLWLMDKLEPNSHAYNIPIYLRALGELHVPLLKVAVNEIIHRHEILRTVFREPEGDASEPRQWILPSVKIDIPVTDLSGLPENKAEAKVRKLAVKHVKKPFDLAVGPLLRLAVLKVANKKHVLLFTIHHIVFDGLSLDIFLKELDILYRAFSQQQRSPLPNLDIQYADYSAWQRQRLMGKHLREHLDFWRDELEGAPPVIGLPSDHPRPAIQSYAGARLSFDINAKTTHKLRVLSQQNGTTLFMTFHVALVILLARYSGKEDIVIGTPVANRNHSQVEPLIGFFANTMVLRSEVNVENSFNELLAHIKSNTLRAFKYQELPFEKLVDELNVERDMSYNPLFQVLYSFQNAHTEGFSLSNVNIMPLAFDYAVSKFDLSFIVREYQEKFSVILEYSTALFEANTIKRMMGYLNTLIEAIVKQPECPVGQLSMLTERDMRQLQTWNETAVDYPLDKTLVDLFEAQVRQTPDNVAVVFEDQQLSYQVLNEKANQLAHYLISQGVQADRLIGICVDRSLEMMIGLLGILKAGGAYVPLDPDYPEARLQFMLEDSQVSLLLMQRHLQDRLSILKTGTLGIQSMVLDGFLDSLEVQEQPYSTQNPERQSKPNNLAYVIYTSGSTGKPKGVMIQHCSLTNHTQWMQEKFGFTADDSILQKTSFSFDASIWEFYALLMVGGTLHLGLPQKQGDIDYICQYLEIKKITILQLVPSLLNAILEQRGFGSTQLRYLFCGGEALTLEAVNKHYQQSSIPLYNLYGPTETTIDATAWYCSPQTHTGSIGQPIANAQIHILDTHQQLQPLGIPGELCIAGAGLARGYLNRPELTAAKFIEVELFGRTERLYRTGDLARWLPDGNLEFLGRLDHQVKLRGFRIELGEIEVALSQHSAINEAVVVLYEREGHQSLAAYLTVNLDAGNDAPISSTEIAISCREHLKDLLPDYMIPTSFTVLETLPLTPNGKTNRQALPKPDRFNTLERSYMHPRNSLELALSQIWENTLNISPISMFDNFFDIGGDSLLAIRLITTTNQQFNVKIPLNSLFQNGTIEQMACLLRRDRQTSIHNSPLVALQTHGANAPIFCVHAAGGIVFRYQQVAKQMSSDYGHPFYGLQAKGFELGETPYASIEVMAQSYVKSIRKFKPHGPYLLAGWSMGGTVAFEMACIMESMGEMVSGVLMIDTPSPYMDAYEADDVDFLLERLEPAAGISIQDEIEQQQSAQAKKQYIIEQKKQLGLFPPDIQLEEAEQRLAVHKHHNRLLCRYQPSTTIKARIAFIRATEETTFDEKMKNPVPAWAEFTHKSIIEYASLGNHFNMFSNEYSPILVERLRACIRDLKI